MKDENKYLKMISEMDLIKTCQSYAGNIDNLKIMNVKLDLEKYRNTLAYEE